MKHLRRIALILLCLLLTACTQEAEQVEYYCTRRVFTRSGITNQTDMTYDEEGRLLSSVTTVDDVIVNNLSYTYNDDGTLVTVTQQTEGGIVTGENHRTFDDQGNVLTEVMMEGDTAVSSYEYTYDENGNLLTQILTSAYGPENSVNTTTYTYDENGNKLSQENTTNYGGQELVNLTEYQYDDQGRLATEIHYSQGQISGTGEYTYDPETRTEIYTFLDAASTVSTRIRRVYDEAENVLLEEQLDADDNVISTVTQTWQGSDGSISQLEDQ